MDPQHRLQSLQRVSGGLAVHRAGVEQQVRVQGVHLLSRVEVSIGHFYTV